MNFGKIQEKLSSTDGGRTYIGDNGLIQVCLNQSDGAKFIQVGILDPFAEDGKSFFVQCLSSEPETDTIRPSWVSDFDYSSSLKELYSDPVEATCVWFTNPETFLKDLYGFLKDDLLYLTAPPKGLRLWKKKNKAAPPLIYYSLSLLAYHGGQFEESEAYLDKCIKPLSTSSEQLEWRRKHQQALRRL